MGGGQTVLVVLVTVRLMHELYSFKPYRNPCKHYFQIEGYAAKGLNCTVFGERETLENSPSPC